MLIEKDPGREKVVHRLVQRKLEHVGRTKHFKKDPHCPAEDKKCNRYKNIGHFENVA